MSCRISGDNEREFVVTAPQAGARLDLFLADRFPGFSRTFLRTVIDAGGARVDGQKAKAAHRLRAGECVAVSVFERKAEGPAPEPIPLEVVYEDDHISVVNKPPGMVVHPAKGHWAGTLAGALAHRYGQLSGVGGPTRPGIVHRLDRDTSGAVVVARTDAAHAGLARQFAARSVEKCYDAIVAGAPDRDCDVIQRPIGIHPSHREKMAVRSGHSTSRDARTCFRVVERFARFALLDVQPTSGRTHQIRVHLSSVGHPVLCDRLYGGRARITAAEITHGGGAESGGTEDRTLIERQALHARRLVFSHPISGQPLRIEVPMPADMQAVLAVLRRHG